MKANSATKTIRAVQLTSCTACLPGLWSAQPTRGRRAARGVCASSFGNEINDRREHGADDHPEHLVPVEKWNPGPGWLDCVVERRPHHRDELDDEEQIPPTPTGAFMAVLI